MTEQYSVRDARAAFSELIKRAEGGESIVVTRDGRPVAQLGPAPIDLTQSTGREHTQARQRAVDGILGRVNSKPRAR